MSKECNNKHARAVRVIGLDLGGGSIKSVLSDGCGAVQARVAMPTESTGGPEHVIARLDIAARRVCETGGTTLGDVLGIGVGSPGPLRVSQGLVIKSANLPQWENVRLRELLSQRTGCAVHLTNDANAAAYGEYRWGSGGGNCDMCMLTLGTGVGGGVVLNGELFHGHFENAGELGHMIVQPDGLSCRCGQRGCLEAYAGGAHLVQRAERDAAAGRSAALAAELRAGNGLDVPAILRCAQQGDAASLALWREACDAIAVACVNLQHAFNPQAIVLGGGLAGAGEVLLEPVRAKHRSLIWHLADDQPEIRLASLGNDAGALGAAAWFLHKQRLC